MRNDTDRNWQIQFSFLIDIGGLVTSQYGLKPIRKKGTHFQVTFLSKNIEKYPIYLSSPFCLCVSVSGRNNKI